MNRYYLLNKKNIPTIIKKVDKWMVGYQQGHNVVKETHVNGKYCATYFTGVNKNGKLFKTELYGDKIENLGEYSNWQDAEKGHDEAIKRLAQYEINNKLSPG